MKRVGNFFPIRLPISVISGLVVVYADVLAAVICYEIKIRDNQEFKIFLFQH